MNALTLLVRAGTMVAVLAGTPRAEAEERPSAGRDDAVVEVHSSEATGTGTILMTRPDGITCLLAAASAGSRT